MSELFRAVKFLVWVVGMNLFLVAQAQVKNFRLGEQPGDSMRPFHPSIAINHKNPGNLVVQIAPDRFLYSQDGGQIWKESTSDPGGALLMDPFLTADSKGNFISFYVVGPLDKAPGDKLGVTDIAYKSSTDEGKSWKQSDFLLSGSRKFPVRPQVSAHFFRGSLFASWTEFDHYGEQDSTCQSNFWFSSSSSGGNRWSDPVRINQIPGDCRDEDNSPMGTAPVMSTEGRLFVAWSNHGSLYFDRSYDVGKTWLGTDIVIAAQPGGSNLAIPGFEADNSNPVMAVDNSASFFRSSLYLAWADQARGEDDTDVWLLRSTTRGDMWWKPVRVNQDEKGRHQFHPSMAVDEETGVIYIVYYDRRSYDDLKTDVYLAYSLDGGNKFSELKISEAPFSTELEKPLSGYTGIAAFKGVIVPVWTQSDKSGASVWTVVLKQDDLFKKEDAPRIATDKETVDRRTLAL